MKSLRFTLNGREVAVEISPSWTLIQVLRDELGLTGTREGCSSGHCGVCTVLLDGEPVNSCLIPAFKADGREVVTIEGLSRPGQLHSVQKAFLDNGAVQCGYCSPGMILAVKALLDQNPKPSDQEVREAISGNLCRCGTYLEVVEAVRSLCQSEEGREDEPG